MSRGRDSDEETIIFNPTEVNRHHGSRKSSPKLAFGSDNLNKSQSQVAPVKGQALFNQLFNQVPQQSVPLVYQLPSLSASSSNVQQQHNVPKQASQVHPERQQGFLVPQRNVPQVPQYAHQSYQQLQALSLLHSQGALPQRMYYAAQPGSTMAKAHRWDLVTQSPQSFPNTAYTYQNPAGQSKTTSMLQMTQGKSNSPPQAMHIDNRHSKQHDSEPSRHSNQHEQGRNSRYHKSYHEEKRNKNKPMELVFRGFTNRYTCQKLQKDLLIQADGGLLKFLSLNSQFILKTGWQKEITPRLKVNDSVGHSASVNRQQLMPQESISPEETSLSDTTTEYRRVLDSASPNEQSEEEIQGILSSLSQLPDFNMDLEPEAGSIMNPGRKVDRTTADGSHYDQEVIRVPNQYDQEVTRVPNQYDQEVTSVSNQYDQEPVASLPSVPEPTIVSKSKNVPSSVSSEDFQSESEDDGSSDDGRHIPSALCSMGNLLRMLHQKAPLAQDGQEGVTGSTMSVSSSAAQTKGKSQQTSPGNAIANRTDQVAKNSDITSFVGKLKTCPRPVGAPRKSSKDQATPSSKPVDIKVLTPVGSVQTNSNNDRTTVKKGMLLSFRIPKVKSVLNMSVSSAELTDEPIALNRNVSTESEGTEDGDSLRSKPKEDNPSDKSSKEKISSASKRLEAKNTNHILSKQLSKEEDKRKEKEKPPKSKTISQERKTENERDKRDSSSENKQTPKSKTASGPSRERKNSENEEGQRRDASSENKDNKIKHVSKKKSKKKKKKYRRERETNSDNEEGQRRDSSNENKQTPKSKTASDPSKNSENEERQRRDASSENKDNTIKHVSEKKPKEKRKKYGGEREEDRNKKKQQKMMDEDHNINSPETENVNNNNPKESKDKEKSLKIDSRRKSEKDTSNSSREVKEMQQQSELSSHPRDKRERRKSSEDSMRERSASREKLGQSKEMKETTAKRKELEETEDNASKRRITETGVQHASNQKSQNPPPFFTQGQGLSMHIDATSSASTVPDSTTIASLAQSPIPRPVVGGGPPINIVTTEKVMPTSNSAKDTSVSSRGVSVSDVTVKPCPIEDSSVTYKPLFIHTPIPIAVTVKSEPLSPERQPHTHTSIKMEQSISTEANSALTNISGAVEFRHLVETIIPKEFQSVRVPLSSSSVMCSRAGTSDYVKTSSTNTSTPVREPLFEDTSLKSESSDSISKTETFESVEETLQVDREKERELTRYTKQWLSGLNYQDSGNPYEDLLKKLKDIGLDIWEEGGCLMYNWEVNLRWLLTHIFRPTDFATFTLNIKHYMTTYPSLPLFFKYIKGDV